MKLLTVQQVAQVTGFAPSTIRRKVREGILYGFKIFGQFRLPDDRLWIDLGPGVPMFVPSCEPSDAECHRRHLAALERIAARRHA